MKSLAAGVIGVAVLAAGGLGVFNLATTGCPLGSCSSEAETDAAATTTVAHDEGSEAKKSCCPLTEGAGAEVVLAADGGEEAGTCSLEKAEACAEKMAACDAEKTAQCQGERMVDQGQGGEVMVVGAPATGESAESCEDKTGCCKEDGCLPGGACCKDKAGDE